MASIAVGIARTIKRLMVGGQQNDGTNYIPKVVTGLSGEFNRLNDYRKLVHRSMAASDNIPVEAIDDIENKYGIDNYLGLTNEERVARIIERASTNGNGGADWLQEQVRQAGFDLYVIENEPKETEEMQYGADTPQYSERVQYAQILRYIDTVGVLGELIVSSPVKKAGRRYDPSSQYGGTTQYSVATLYGTVDEDFTYPQPGRFLLPTDSKYWKYVFFLSPFSTRIVETESELLEVTAEQFRYLRKLIIQTKFLRNWCIAQVKIVG